MSDPPKATTQKAGRLAVVCTPIGNLADLAPRAAEVLAKADIVLCEDTRHSKPLLDKVGSHARLVSCHAHNERDRRDLVVEALTKGERVALVSDAGAPSISDPGGRIVEEIVQAGLAVEVFPGPTALTAALMGAGIDVARFSFLGFLPKSGRPRRTLIDAGARSGLGLALYEAPQRVDETLRDLFEALGPRRVVVARELTKLHETFHRGKLAADGVAALAPAFVEKGEVVILVEAGEAKADVSAADVESIARDESLPPKERAKRLAAALGIPVKEAYARVQQSGGDPASHVRKALEHLARAASALVDADTAARKERGEAPRPPVDVPANSDIAGADALMALLAQGTSMRAPVETNDAAKQVLAALSSMDGLLDALAFEREGRDDDD
jgi:16S rRNA (cytidine1402-2'-O)-methyltransferase